LRAREEIRSVLYAFAGLIYTDECLSSHEIPPRFMTSLLERSLINIAEKGRHWKGSGVGVRRAEGHVLKGGITNNGE